MSEIFEIKKTLVVYAAHMNDDDITHLNKRWFAFESYDYGYRIFITNDKTLEDHCLESIGFSEGFRKSLLLARVLQCDRIEFDCDGPKIEEIPEYDSEADIYGN